MSLLSKPVYHSRMWTLTKVKYSIHILTTSQNEYLKQII